MILLTGGESMERLFGLDWQMIADASLMIIAIFVLFLLMSYFLFNPARKLLADRRQKIQDELNDARQNMDSAKALKQDYEGRIREVDKEAEAILSEARKKAMANESQIIAQAREEARHIIERARTEAELEKRKAADEMKQEMISIASIMAGKIVAASIDTSVQNNLIDETLKEIGENTWLS